MFATGIGKDARRQAAKFSKSDLYGPERELGDHCFRCKLDGLTHLGMRHELGLQIHGQAGDDRSQRQMDGVQIRCSCDNLAESTLFFLRSHNGFLRQLRRVRNGWGAGGAT